MIYIATFGNKYKIEPFEGSVPLKKDHKETLQGKVMFLDETKLIITTALSYDVGQEVSIGGFPTGGKWFTLRELSITNNPVLPNAKIIERED